MKTDARVRYTQKVIKDAFLSLLQEKPAGKITVTEVCDKAEINRGTFYKHYQDCYDLMDKLQEDALMQFDEMLATVETTGAQPMLVSILRALQNNRILVGKLDGRENSSGSFVSRLIGRCFGRMDVWLNTEPTRHWAGNPQRTMSYAFLAGGSSAIIEYWMQSGMRESPEVVAEEIVALCEITIKGMTA